jgi:hypothetical protein
MGHSYVTASKSIRLGTTKITSVNVTPLNGAVCGHCTLYNATAATANAEVLYFHTGTANPRSVSWHDVNGLEVDNLWCAVNCAYATIIWD